MLDKAMKIGTDGGHYERRDSIRTTIKLPRLSLEQQLWNQKVEAKQREKAKAKQQRKLVEQFAKERKHA